MYNRIGFYPEDRLRKENSYFQSVKECLNRIKWDVVDYRNIYKDGSIQVVDFNFFENITAKNTIIAVMKFMKRLMILFYLKATNRKIVFTMHNKIPHDTKHPFLSKKMIQLLLSKSDAIVALCNETRNVIYDFYDGKSIDKKIYVIPHPKYCTLDFSKNRASMKSCSTNTFVVTFAGQIRKYKNIELIIELAREFRNENVLFLIAGKEENESYKNELQKKAKGLKNIKFKFGYLSDDELNEIIVDSDMLILPYNKTSSLNSGMLFLAFSLQTTCLCPDIGSALDVNDQSCFYMYEYKSQEEHYNNLREKFIVALEDYRKGNLQLKGKRCKQEVDIYNSLDRVQQEYQKLLEDIL